MQSRFLAMLLVVVMSGLTLISVVTSAQDFSELTPQEQQTLVLEKQAEVERAAQNPWSRLRWALAEWLPWIAGIGLLFVIWQWGLTRCPKCRRHFPKLLSSRLSGQSTSSSRRITRKYCCRRCAHEWEVESFYLPGSRSPSQQSGTSSTPGKTPPRSSGGSSGFGGGSSGGGGATRGY